ncbi:esterase/lipase family protein [Plantactinospora sp. DSM 117369]
MIGVVASLSVVAPASAAPGSASAAPVRDDSVNEPVYFIHGFDGQPNTAGFDCDAYWGDAIAAMRGWGWIGVPLTVGYYSNDSNCAEPLESGSRNTSLSELGKILAWTIHHRFSYIGRSVDVIAHSMGGLIIRDALTGVQEGQEGYPPYLYVEDVVTLSTPHARGSALANLCATFMLAIQCLDMAGRTGFLDSLGGNPQGSHGTDWTVVGYEDDFVVPASVATNMQAKHKVIYTGGQHGMNHDNMRWQTTGTWRHKYSNNGGGTWTGPVGNQAAPIRVANNGCYWHSAW